MEFRLLGPVEIWSGDRIDPGRPRQRTVLAALAADAGRLVTMESLIDRVWGEDPPRRARDTLYPYVTRLRRIIEETAARERSGARLLHRSGGYVLDADPDDVDLLRFRRLAEDAAATPDAAARLAGLREAMALCRGEPLAGLRGEWAARVRDAWQRRRAEVTAAWARAEVGDGDPGRVIGPLTELMHDHPLMEVPAATLVRALSATGRDAEALEVFGAVRRRLADELGADPGADLRAAHRDALRGGSRAHRAEDPARPAGQVHLPLDAPHFTGRRPQLAELGAYLDAENGATAVVTGKAGVGKTSLAVRVAHQLAHRFPDGRLFLDLGGVAARPAPAGETLTRILRLLGGDTADTAARAERYQALLAPRRILVVLDNVVDESQVRSLLPWSPGSKVVVTSRTPLAGLTDAKRLWLPELDERESMELLDRTAGSGRVPAERDAARRIVDLCGRLPLAIRIAGAKLATKRHWTVADLAERLDSEQRRLDELAAGDLAVRASLMLSYQALDERAQHVFRVLGQFTDGSFPVWSPATAVGMALPDMADVLERLVDWHLLDVVGRDQAGRQRYRMHDLIALFARELQREAGAAADRQVAKSRALEAWLAIFDAMETRLIGDRRLPGAPGSPSGTSYPLGWLPAFRSSLSAGVDDSVHTVLDSAWSVTSILVAMSFELWSQWDDWAMTREAGLHAARRVDDRLMITGAEGAIPEELRIKPGRDDPWATTVDTLQSVVRTFKWLGEVRWHAVSLLTLGNVLRAHGDLDTAGAILGECVDLFRELGNPDWEAAALLGLGSLRCVQGDLDGTVRAYRGCLDIFADRGDALWLAYTRRAVGYAYQQHGRFAEAVAEIERALPVLRRHGDQMWEAHALLTLGSATSGLDRPDEAAAYLDACVRMFRANRDPRSEAVALRARAHTGAGDPEPHLRAALAVFLRLENPVGTALTLRDLGLVRRRQGRTAEAARLLAMGRSLCAGTPLPGLASLFR